MAQRVFSIIKPTIVRQSNHLRNPFIINSLTNNAKANNQPKLKLKPQWPLLIINKSFFSTNQPDNHNQNNNTQDTNNNTSNTNNNTAINNNSNSSNNNPDNNNDHNNNNKNNNDQKKDKETPYYEDNPYAMGPLKYLKRRIFTLPLQDRAVYSIMISFCFGLLMKMIIDDREARAIHEEVMLEKMRLERKEKKEKETQRQRQKPFDQQTQS